MLKINAILFDFFGKVKIKRAWRKKFPELVNTYHYEIFCNQLKKVKVVK